MASISQSSIDCGFGSGMASIGGSLWLHCRPQLGQFNTEFFPNEYLYRPSREAPRSSLYCNSGGPIHTPISGPYAATTIVPPVLPGTRVGDTGNYRTGDIAAVNRSKAYPVARGAQGTHELENLLHSGYSNSASSSSETSSFGKRSGVSWRQERFAYFYFRPKHLVEFTSKTVDLDKCALSCNKRRPSNSLSFCRKGRCNQTL